MTRPLPGVDRREMAGKLVNPFYVGLLIAGAAFAVTACAYGVVSARLDQLARSGAGGSATGYVGWMEQYGAWLLFSELAVLGAMAAGAVGMDDYGSKRTKRGRDGDAASRHAEGTGFSDEVRQ